MKLDLLVNISIVTQVLPVAKGANPEKFKRYIREAQDLDFKTLVCDVFYFDLILNHDSTIYQTLLKGDTYTFEDEIYQFQGIETVLSYFAFARYAMDSPIVSTSHGRVVKETNFSTSVDLKQRKDDYHRYQHDATCYWQDIKLYLERNTDTYEKYECENVCTGSEKKSLSITILK